MNFFSKYSILGGGGSSDVVTSLNTLIGDVTLAAGAGVTITPSGNTLTIAAPQVGTVTSVALTLPNIFSVSGSPITSSGTLTATLATQSANTVFAGPTTGSPATPTFRSLVAADIPDAMLTDFSNAIASTVDLNLNSHALLRLTNLTDASNLVSIDVANRLLNDSSGAQAASYGTFNTNPTYWGSNLPGILIDGNTGAAQVAGGGGLLFRGDSTFQTLTILTDDKTGTDNSAVIGISTGYTVDGDSGSVDINSGNVSGNANSGSINIQTGSSSGGTRGNIVLDGASISVLSDIIPITTDVVSIGDSANKTKQVFNVNGDLKLGTSLVTNTWNSSPIPSLVLDGQSAAAISAFGAGIILDADESQAALLILTKDATTNGSSEIWIGTGFQADNTSGATGLVYLFTGDITNGGNNDNTGAITLRTGSTPGNGASGNISILTGSSSGGTRGLLDINALKLVIHNNIEADITAENDPWSLKTKDTTSSDNSISINIEAGGTVSGTAGQSRLVGGSTTDGVAGDAFMSGGAASAENGTPGWSVIYGGSSNDSAIPGGSILLSSGPNGDGGAAGDVTLRTGTGASGNIILDDSLSLLKLVVPSTITPAMTTGDQEINKISGTVNIAAAGSSITVTNSLVTANSIVMAVVRTNDSTAVIKNVVPTSGAFTIRTTAAVTAETSIGFFVLN